jgi:hypothetical protein
MAVGIINRQSFPDFNNNLTIQWMKAYTDFPKSASILYNIDDTDVDTGMISSLDGFSLAKRKREGQDFAYLNLNQNYDKPWFTYEVGGMAKITWNMRRYAKYNLINTAIQNLATSTAQRMEVDMTHRFTFANSTSYVNYDGDTVPTTVGDGQALLSTAHTVPGSSITFRNRVANNPILSKGGLEAGERLFASQMIDTNGQITIQNPTHIVISNNPTLKNTAMEYLKSSADVTAAQAGVTNPYEGKYGLIILPYLATTGAFQYDSTKQNLWFLVNLDHKDGYVKVGQNPTFISPEAADGVDFENGDWKYATQASYAIEIADPRWVVGSLGDGTP